MMDWTLYISSIFSWMNLSFNAFLIVFPSWTFLIMCITFMEFWGHVSQLNLYFLLMSLCNRLLFHWSVNTPIHLSGPHTSRDIPCQFRGRVTWISRDGHAYGSPYPLPQMSRMDACCTSKQALLPVESTSDSLETSSVSPTDSSTWMWGRLA